MGVGGGSVARDLGVGWTVGVEPSSGVLRHLGRGVTSAASDEREGLPA